MFAIQLIAGPADGKRCDLFELPVRIVEQYDNYSVEYRLREKLPLARGFQQLTVYAYEFVGYRK